MDIFNFISDDHLKQSLLSDYQELEICIENKAYKAVYVLSGSIIEAVLVDHLLTINTAELSPEKILKMELNSLIDKCYDLGIININNKNLLTVLKYYRNLIHPGRELRLQESINARNATISRQLVDIVLEEINKKKRDNYGYTASQIIEKIISDSSSDSIIEHLIQGMNKSEIKRLLLEKLPSKYIEIKAYEDWENPVDHKLEPLAKCYKRILDKVDSEIQTLVIRQYLKVIKEEGSYQVECYDNAFARLRYMNFLDYIEQQVIIDHLLSRLDEEVDEKIFNSIEDIGKYLVGEKAISFMQKMVKYILSNRKFTKSGIALARLEAEYSHLSETDRKSIIDKLESLRNNYDLRNNTDLVATTQNIIDTLEVVDDIPF